VGSTCLTRVFPEATGVEEEVCCPDARVCAGAAGKCCPEGERCCDGACIPTDGCCVDSDCGDPCLVCAANVCTPTACATGLTCCGGDCVDLGTSAAHCGACDRACDGGTICQAGDCVACTADYQSCSSGDECCSGFCMVYGASGNQCEPCEGTLCSGFVCTDLNNDDNNCGACGNACAPGLGCRDGECSDCRRSGESCTGGDCCSAFDYCYDFGTVKVCATCFPPNEVCGDTCCDSSEVCCHDGSYCSALRDDANCGACGEACDPGFTCYGGTCSDCVPNEWDCQRNADCCSGFCGFFSLGFNECRVCEHTICGDLICADTNSDPQHCGGCNQPCAGPSTCINGICIAPSSS
jgi:hypothetical protein